MSSLARLRRAPWLTGTILLLLVSLLLAPVAATFGLRYWPFYAGAAAALLLAAGWLERVWQSRALPRPRLRNRGHLHVVRRGKGNGEASDDETDEPRWLM